jgi:hypothetical protein
MNSSGKWSLADRNNTTNTDSARALDFTTQYQGSVVYDRNLQDMYSNSMSELKDLQFKARERAPYNTNLCTLKPMYPTWNATQPCFPPGCGLNMHPTCFGNSPCNAPATVYAGIHQQDPLCPNGINPNLYIPGALDSYAQQAIETAVARENLIGTGLKEPFAGCAASEDSDSDASDASDASDCSDVAEEVIVVADNASMEPAKIKPMKRMSRNMMRTLMGVAYDLNHWKDLPPQKSRLSTGKTLKFVMGRDNRPLYIVMLIAFFVFIIAIMVGIGCLVKKANHRSKRKKVLKDLQEKAYLQYQMQNMMPPLTRPPYENSLMGGLRRW